MDVLTCYVCKNQSISMFDFNVISDPKSISTVYIEYNLDEKIKYVKVL